jgi:hypothetical protein
MTTTQLHHSHKNNKDTLKRVKKELGKAWEAATATGGNPYTQDQAPSIVEVLAAFGEGEISIVDAHRVLSLLSTCDRLEGVTDELHKIISPDEDEDD